MFAPNPRGKFRSNLFKGLRRQGRGALVALRRERNSQSLEKGRKGKLVAEATNLENPPARRGSPVCDAKTLLVQHKRRAPHPSLAKARATFPTGEGLRKKANKPLDKSKFETNKKEQSDFSVVLNGEFANTKFRQRTCFLCRFVL